MKKYIMMLSVLVAVCLSVFGVHSLVSVDAGEQETIPSTVYIGDTDVSGMTKEEAENVLETEASKISNTMFTLSTGDRHIQVSAEDLGLSAANPEIVEEALHLGKTGNLIARYKDKKDLEHEPKRYTLRYQADENKIETLLGTNKENLNQEAVNSTLKRENNAFTIIEGKNGIEVDVAESVKKIQSYLEEEWEGGSTSIELATKVTEPEGSKEQLSKVKDVLGSFHTDFSSSSAGRYKNVENGANKINGSVVYPGEQFSVYETVSPFDAENGYELAGSYENGTTVQSYGGGICQVSTTLYNAVIRAELEIVTRAAHSMIVSYVEPSMDAAIADGIKDLQFKNNQETPIYIEGYTSGGIIYFNIYGKETRPSNRRVDFVSEVTSQTEPEKEYVAVGDQPVGYIETTTKPHIGYTARLWKIVYENDVEVSRKVFNNSKYNPSKEVISVGVGGATPEAAAAINAAIATKDDATIRSTIASYTPEAQAAAAQAAADAAAAQAAAAAAAQQQQQQTQTTTTPSAAGTPAGTTTGATPGTTSGTAQ